MKEDRFQLLVARCRFFGLLVVVLASMAWTAQAAQPLWENDAFTNDPVPTPDATNFYNNNGTFIIDFPSFGLYQTHDTVNYTNTGYMQAIYGFNFDTFSTASGLNSEAGSFDNENTIDCAEQCIVWATNITNPGWIYVDDGFGLAQFTGSGIDFSGTTVALQNGLTPGNAYTNSLDWGIGTDTNAEWQPSIDLTASTALSSEFHSQLFVAPIFDTLSLIPSLSYFNFAFPATNLTIIRSAFVENNNINTPYNVYFGAVNVGNGFVTVGWSGIYTNIATGGLLTNYLYLNDIPEEVLTNGEKAVNGIPSNYTFTGSQTPLVNLSPTPSSYIDVFNTGTITNNYSYVEAQFISTTISTNLLTFTNVSAIAGRVMINASQELNLNNSAISGANYMNLTSTNQFDGTGGVGIAVPYCDIDIGVTNGNLVVSNLVQSTVPVWSGTIQAWTTDWLNLITNTILTLSTNGTFSTNSYTVTNDFRVELVNSTIAPIAPSQVQNLTLLGTNSVVISDNLNVFGSLFINAQSLTLTTNGIGVGADSEEGTLNVENNNIFWPSALPNLHWLTNNGAISLGNLAIFGTAAPNFVTNVTAAIPAVAAIGSLSGMSLTTNGLGTNNVTIGSYTYKFVNKLTNTVPNQVAIASTFGGTMSNLIAAIDHAAGAGTLYSSVSVSNAFVTAGPLSNNVVNVTAITNGAADNSIATTVVSTNLFWSAATLLGGSNAVPAMTNVVSFNGPYGAFVNNGSIVDFGSQIYANYFENSGPFFNELGSFVLNSYTVILTNGSIFADAPFPPTFTNGLVGNISITANSLVASNVQLEAGGGLILQVTNLLTDMFTNGPGVTNASGNIWTFDGGAGLVGLDLPIQPAAGDLLGTTISVTTPSPNKTVKNFWSGHDFGVSTSGFNNNEAVGQLVLDATGPNTTLSFAGTSISNAIYVDRLVLNNYASYVNGVGSANIPTILLKTNIVIYYADAIATTTVNGGPYLDVSYQLNHSNTNRFRWVPEYTGFFSSTNLVYPNGTTNTVNLGLVTSPYLDSNGDGIPNAGEIDPIFVSSQVNFNQTLTNGMEELTWDSIPSSTNTVFSTTNMAVWNVVTNFVSPSQVPPAGGWPITNIVFEPITGPMTFYRVGVSPNSVDVYGN